MMFFYPFRTIYYRSNLPKEEILQAMRFFVQDKVNSYSKWGNPKFDKPYFGVIKSEGFEIYRINRNGKSPRPDIVGQCFDYEKNTIIKVKFKEHIFMFIWFAFIGFIWLYFNKNENGILNLQFIILLVILAVYALLFNKECAITHNNFKLWFKAEIVDNVKIDHR